jgi:hypothetical protein
MQQCLRAYMADACVALLHTRDDGSVCMCMGARLSACQESLGFMGLVCKTSGGRDCRPVRFCCMRRARMLTGLPAHRAEAQGAAQREGVVLHGRDRRGASWRRNVASAAWIYGHSLPLHGHMLAGVLCTWEGCGAIAQHAGVCCFCFSSHCF